MPRVPTCIIWFLSGAALLSLLSFLKLFIATKPSWYEDSAVMVDDLPSLLRMIYFPSSLLPGPNYYSNNSRRQPPLPLAHWHTGKIPHCCWAQAASCFPGLQGCHRDCALQSLSAALGSECRLWPPPPALPSISKGPFQLALAQPCKKSPPGPSWQHQ